MSENKKKGPVNTRKHSKCPIFGDPCDFSKNQLPNYDEVIKCYPFVRKEMKGNNGKDYPVSVIASEVAEKVQAIYKRALIPCVTKKRMIAKVKEYHQTFRSIMKSYQSKKNSAAFQTKLEKFKDESKKLFDFASCKCKDLENCNCSKELKIPVMERSFMKDQRTDRKMYIGNCDLRATKLLRKRSLRREGHLNLAQKTVERRLELPDFIKETVQGFSDSDEDSSDQDFVLTGHKRKSFETVLKSPQNSKRPRLLNLALACERTGVSDRSAAMISSSVLQDYGIISADSFEDVIDRNKIRRSKNDIRKEVNAFAKNNASEIQSLYFDGRKDQTLINEKKGDSYHKKNIMEEHITLMSEPGSNYLGHVSVSQGTSECITKAIWDFFEDKDCFTDSIQAIGCDGTAVNTKTKGGIIRLLETKLGRPLHWFICQLHANELPLRHLIKTLDGKTTGPRGYTGEIGKQLEECEKYSVCDFDAIETSMPRLSDEAKDELSCDQKYLYEIIRAVETGHVSERLANLYPGKMAHSRWLTTANRIMRLYVSVKNPFDTLKNIAHFVSTVYAPGWFIIKMNSHAVNGAKNLQKILKLCCNLSEDIFAIVKPVVQRNAYFAHPENILIAMINDERSYIRELGWRRILKAKKMGYKGIRRFKLPHLVFESTDYVNMINWQENEITEPPLCKKLTNTEIENNIRNKTLICFPALPSHTQAVERTVKLVTDASQKVIGRENRDGHINALLTSRSKLPKFNTKKDYVF